MMELPEAMTIAGQLNKTVYGKKISGVTAGLTPHKLAWYYGDPAQYAGLLVGKTADQASAIAGLVEIKANSAAHQSADILLGEASAIRFIAAGQSPPPKHQLLIEFEDGSALVSFVQMYGGMGCFPEGQLDNPYYKVAKEKPSPFSSRFDRVYFGAMISPEEVQKLSLKAFLATEQRIPGLGNGVLQDILFSAKMHPKKKVGTLSAAERDSLFDALKATLASMLEGGGRDTELDLFGQPGGYKTILSKNSANKPCPLCGTMIKKEAYMGGSIYYCPSCQKI